MRPLAAYLGLLIAWSLAACGSGLPQHPARQQPPAPLAASTEPSAPSAVAAEQASAATETPSVPSAASTLQPTEEPALVLDEAAYAQSATLPMLDHMPKQCDEGRMVVRFPPLLQGGASAQLDALLTKLAAGAPKDRGGKLLAALKAGGATVSTLRAFAMCKSTHHDQTVALFELALPKTTKLPELMERALGAARRKPPTREDHGPVTMFLPTESSGIIATVGKALVVIGDQRSLVERVVAGTPDNGFGEAAGTVVWYRSFGKEPGRLDVVEKGDGYDVELHLGLGAAAAQDMLHAFQSFLGRLPELAKHVPPLGPLDKPLRTAQVAVQGDELVATGHVSKQVLAAAVRAAGSMDPKKFLSEL